jgi:hypothetical protein
MISPRFVRAWKNCGGNAPMCRLTSRLTMTPAGRPVRGHIPAAADRRPPTTRGSRRPSVGRSSKCGRRPTGLKFGGRGQASAAVKSKSQLTREMDWRKPNRWSKPIHCLASSLSLGSYALSDLHSDAYPASIASIFATAPMPQRAWPRISIRRSNSDARWLRRLPPAGQRRSRRAGGGDARG